MKLLAAVLLLLPAAAMADDAASEVVDRMRAFGEAWAEGDEPGAAKFLHADYRHVDVAGKVLDRAGWLATMKGRTTAKYVTELDDLDVRVYGDMAVVTGRNVFWPKGRDPVAFRQEMRFMQVWLRAKGQWLRLAFQGTPVR